MPFDQLRAHGWQAGYGLSFPEDHDPDIIVGQRLDQPPMAEFWRKLAGDYKLVYEVDDNPFALDPVNWLARPMFGNDEIRQAMRDCAAASHMVTVTTEPLAEVFREFNNNVVVLPNRIPALLLAHERKRHEVLTIGWLGGASHGRDLALIAQAWRDAVDEHEARGHFVGMEYLNMLRPRRFDWTRWISDPADCFAAVDFDIGLAPLSDHPFNDCKSPIKVMEYAALGVPCVASDHPVYRPAVLDGVTGFLCATQAEWRDRIALLACDHQLREHMGIKARELAATWTIEEHWPAWARAYLSLG